MVLSGCAKDTGGTTGGSASGGKPCQTNPAPTGPPLTTHEELPSPLPDASHLRVGLAFDIGGRGDGSFNDASAAGLERAKQQIHLGETKELDSVANEPEDAKLTRLRQLAQEGFNPVIAVGYSYADAVGTVAKEFPGTRFAIIDDDTVHLPNVTPLVFSEEQGSFLAGVIAAHKSKTCHIGFVGGVETPLIKKFQAGYVAGAKAAAPDIKIDSDYLTPAGDYSGFQDPNKGSEVTSGFLDGGADVIYHAAGASGKGVFSAVQAKGDAMAIGVDSDQYKQPTVAAYKDVIISSMLKRIDLAVFSYVADFAAGDPGRVPARFNIANGGVTYATSGGKVDDLKPTLDAYAAAIARGDIKVPTTP